MSMAVDPPNLFILNWSLKRNRFYRSNCRIRHPSKPLCILITSIPKLNNQLENKSYFAIQIVEEWQDDRKLAKEYFWH